MTKKTKLGRGLDILLSHSKSSLNNNDENDRLHDIPVNLLQRGRFQPREEIDPETLAELSQSIKAQGIIQPIVARKIGSNQYEIIAGERRWRAAQLAGLDKIPTTVREVSDQVAVAIALIENIQRESLTPLEEAKALQRLIEEFAMTHSEVASAVGRSRSSVTNLIRLLQLNYQVKTLLSKGDIQMGHGRALLALADEEQFEVANQIVQKNFSVRQAEQLVKRFQQKKKNSHSSPTDQSLPHLQSAVNELSKKLAMRIDIKENNHGKGRIVIHYQSQHELNQLISKF